MTPETPREAGRHASERCPALWRCRVPLKGQRGATQVSYTEPELAADLAAHFWIGCDTTHFPSKDAALVAPATGLPAASGLRAARDYAESLHDDPIKYGSPLDAARNTARAIMVFIDNQIAADRAERGLPLDVDRDGEPPFAEPAMWAYQYAGALTVACDFEEGDIVPLLDLLSALAEGRIPPVEWPAVVPSYRAALVADPQSPTGEGA